MGGSHRLDTMAHSSVYMIYTSLRPGQQSRPPSSRGAARAERRRKSLSGRKTRRLRCVSREASRDAHDALRRYGTSWSAHIRHPSRGGQRHRAALPGGQLEQQPSLAGAAHRRDAGRPDGFEARRDPRARARQAATGSEPPRGDDPRQRHAFRRQERVAQPPATPGHTGSQDAADPGRDRSRQERQILLRRVHRPLLVPPGGPDHDLPRRAQAGHGAGNGGRRGGHESS